VKKEGEKKEESNWEKHPDQSVRADVGDKRKDKENFLFLPELIESIFGMGAVEKKKNCMGGGKKRGGKKFGKNLRLNDGKVAPVPRIIAMGWTKYERNLFKL